MFCCVVMCLVVVLCLGFPVLAGGPYRLVFAVRLSCNMRYPSCVCRAIGRFRCTHLCRLYVFSVCRYAARFSFFRDVSSVSASAIVRLAVSLSGSLMFLIAVFVGFLHD